MNTLHLRGNVDEEGVDVGDDFGERVQERGSVVGVVEEKHLLQVVDPLPALPQILFEATHSVNQKRRRLLGNTVVECALAALQPRPNHHETPNSRLRVSQHVFGRHHQLLQQRLLPLHRTTNPAHFLDNVAGVLVEPVIGDGRVVEPTALVEPLTLVSILHNPILDLEKDFLRIGVEIGPFSAVTRRRLVVHEKEHLWLLLLLLLLKLLLKLLLLCRLLLLRCGLLKRRLERLRLERRRLRRRLLLRRRHE